MTKFITSIICFCIISITAFAQGLSDKEKEILARIDANHAEALEFLETNVNINSGTMNFEGVRKVGDNYHDAYEALGFETRWVSQDEVNRAGHFFAEQEGSEGKSILLIGHLDTVFEEESPFQEYKVLNDSVAAGPGVADMKAGNVMILYALKALKEAGALPNTQILVALTGDEEKAGDPVSVSRKSLTEAAKRSDIALGFEGASGFSYATVARRASNSWYLEVEGRQAHSSGVFSDYTGAGSVYEASRILSRFYEELQEDNLTYNVGMILGSNAIEYDRENIRGSASGKLNIVPKKTIVHGDIRFLTREQGDRTYKKMEAIVDDHLPQTSAKIEFVERYPPMEPTEGNMEVLDVLSQLSQDMGLGEVEAFDPGRRGAADISFIAKYVDGLDGLGVMGRGSHSPNETLNLKTYKALTKRAALLIYRLSRQSPEN
ncbi:MAG: M20 family metallopeptidase [Balneolaceae bacterium]|nr:M20 family metallopeptidase [Balneolaceae bacterium]